VQGHAHAHAHTQRNALQWQAPEGPRFGVWLGREESVFVCVGVGRGGNATWGGGRRFCAELESFLYKDYKTCAEESTAYGAWLT
jgi:hypothetical protein